MQYNVNLSYNYPNVTYNGVLVLNISSVISPVIINNATVIFSTTEDNSNYTTMGIISYDIDPYGIMTFEVTQDQANAIVNASFIVIETSAEVQVTNISTSGTLLVP